VRRGMRGGNEGGWKEESGGSTEQGRAGEERGEVGERRQDRLFCMESWAYLDEEGCRGTGDGRFRLQVET
jgi:hypothetical protein